MNTHNFAMASNALTNIYIFLYTIIWAEPIHTATMPIKINRKVRHTSRTDWLNYIWGFFQPLNSAVWNFRKTSKQVGFAEK